MDTEDTPGKRDPLARILCVIVGTAWAVAAAVAYSAGPDATIWFWLLSAFAVLFVVAAVFGPRWLRTALVGWFW